MNFICTDCGARVWQAIQSAHQSTHPRCYICDWLHQHPDCPSAMRDRLRNPGKELNDE